MSDSPLINPTLPRQHTSAKRRSMTRVSELIEVGADGEPEWHSPVFWSGDGQCGEGDAFREVILQTQG